MKWTVRFTRPSTEDIIDAIQRHKRDDPPRDQDFLNSIRQVVGHISEFPEAAALVSSKLFKRRDKVRELPCGPYRFIYLFRDDVCWVLAVIHGRRHLPKAWKERQRPIPPPEEPSYKPLALQPVHPVPHHETALRAPSLPLANVNFVAPQLVAPPCPAYPDRHGPGREPFRGIGLAQHQEGRRLRLSTD